MASHDTAVTLLIPAASAAAACPPWNPADGDGLGNGSSHDGSANESNYFLDPPAERERAEIIGAVLHSIITSPTHCSSTLSHH